MHSAMKACRSVMWTGSWTWCWGEGTEEDMIAVVCAEGGGEEGGAERIHPLSDRKSVV